jgi:hypothetical protein
VYATVQRIAMRNSEADDISHSLLLVFIGISLLAVSRLEALSVDVLSELDELHHCRQTALFFKQLISNFHIDA